MVGLLLVHNRQATTNRMQISLLMKEKTAWLTKGIFIKFKEFNQALIKN
jgi:hypothetical protein